MEEYSQKKEISQPSLFQENFLTASLRRRHSSRSSKIQDEELRLMVEEKLQVEPISKSLISLEKYVFSDISAWAESLQNPLQNIIDNYYSLLKENRENTNNTLDGLELTEEELELLQLVDNFDLESLNLYKDISVEESELMKLTGSHQMT